jgi:hypothetical protein
VSHQPGTRRKGLEIRPPNHHLGRLADSSIAHTLFQIHVEDAMNVKTQIKAGDDDTIIWGN